MTHQVSGKRWVNLIVELANRSALAYHAGFHCTPFAGHVHSFFPPRLTLFQDGYLIDICSGYSRVFLVILWVGPSVECPLRSSWFDFGIINELLLKSPQTTSTPISVVLFVFSSIYYMYHVYCGIFNLSQLTRLSNLWCVTDTKYVYRTQKIWYDDNMNRK